MTEIQTGNENAIDLLAQLEAVGGVIDRGLQLPPDLAYETYETIGAMLTNLNNMSRWFLGDWLNYGEHTYGEKWAQAEAVTGLAKSTLENYMSIAKKVPPQRRRVLVSFSTHGEVAALPPAEQKRILKIAEDERLTKTQVRDLAREANGEVLPKQELTRDFCEACGRPLL